MAPSPFINTGRKQSDRPVHKISVKFINGSIWNILIKDRTFNHLVQDEQIAPEDRHFHLQDGDEQKFVPFNNQVVYDDSKDPPERLSMRRGIADYLNEFPKRYVRGRRGSSAADLFFTNRSRPLDNPSEERRKVLLSMTGTELVGNRARLSPRDRDSNKSFQYAATLTKRAVAQSKAA
ncbi:hypothetical protein PRZ48_010245 [Zasmidium cellare]|uniref:Uncharacterized protein n=1 Tax=Zasmidium cellare TaxID=395010 RepID=A0ABR0E834_ZASCE|nr:hypothetical protein PRZ48_010245 [Zasmidium cellare]